MKPTMAPRLRSLLLSRLRPLRSSVVCLILCPLLWPLSVQAIGYIYTDVDDDGRACLELTSVTVDVSIQDRVAVTRTDQVFTNHSDRVLEGIYEFVLPEGAIITDLVLWIEGKRVQALILEKELARNAYDAIVAGRADPALIEQVADNLFRLSIFPFPPESTRRVELEYAQILESRHGVTRYRFPMAPEADRPVQLELVLLRAEVRVQHPFQIVASEAHQAATEIERPDNLSAARWQHGVEPPDAAGALTRASPGLDTGAGAATGTARVMSG